MTMTGVTRREKGMILLHPLRFLKLFVLALTGADIGRAAGDPVDAEEDMDPDWDGDWDTDYAGNEIEID